MLRSFWALGFGRRNGWSAAIAARDEAKLAAIEAVLLARYADFGATLASVRFIWTQA